MNPGKIWEAIKKNLDMLAKCEIQCESHWEINMSLVKELEGRIAQFKAEVEELEKRKRILSARIMLLEKALHTEKDAEVDWLDGEPTSSKAQAVREIIQSQGEAGATTADVRDALDKLGYSLKRNFVYSTLARLREDGEVTKKGERYFWKKAN